MTFSDLIQDIKKKYIIYIWVFIVGPVVVWNFYMYTERKREENTIRITFDTELAKIAVEDVSFARGGFRINEDLYLNINDKYFGDLIFHRHSGITTHLKEIYPPYDLYKEKNNDSLFIAKDGVKYYLLVQE